MPFQPAVADRWRDRAIVAQVAAKCAVDLIKDREDATSDQFDVWTEVIYNKILSLVGEPPPSPATSQGSGRAGAVPSGQRERGSGSPQGSGGQDPGTVVFRGGKWAGSTIDAVYNSTDGEGKSGADYLRWAAKNMTGSQWLQSKIQQYLDSKDAI